MTNEEQGCMRKSTETGKIFTAIRKTQEGISCPAKNKTGNTGGRSYRYVDLPAILDAIKVPLHDNELSIIQIPIKDEQTIGIETTITHASGEWISGKLLLPVADNKAQAAGSAITYARRYAITAMLGLAADDDDDGGMASQQRPPVQQPRQTAAMNKTSQPQNNAANRPVSPPVDTSLAPPRQAQPEQGEPPACGICKGPVTEAERAYSMGFYKKPYCYRCQQDMKKTEASLRQGPGN